MKFGIYLDCSLLDIYEPVISNVYTSSFSSPNLNFSFFLSSQK